jgi:hypothetical protein
LKISLSKSSPYQVRAIFAKERGAKPVVYVATFDFGPAYADPKVSFTMMLSGSSEIIASS